MAFIKEYIDYSAQSIVKAIPNYTNNTSLNVPFVFNGNNYTVKTVGFNLDRITIVLGTPYGSIVKDTPLYIIKSKDQDIYILFTLKSDNTINISVNNQPNLTNAVSITNSSGTYFDRRTWFIALTEDFIALIGNFTLSVTNAVGVGLSLESIKNFMGEIEASNSSPEYGDASDSDGYDNPSFDDTSDIIEMPIQPPIGVSNAGFINVYNIDNNALVNLGSELFPKYETPPPLLVPDDLTSALINGINEQVKMIGYLMDTIANKNIVDYVIDCHCIPVSGVYGEDEQIKIGGRTFTPLGKKIASDYIDFDCGTLNIKEYYSNFIDYVGTRAKVYLPFVGFVPLQNEYFQNGFLNIKYRFNVIDGSFMCFLISTSSKSELTDSVVASYGGNACIHIPLTGLNYSNMVSSILNGSIGAVANISMGNTIGALNSAMNTLAVKPDMQSSNGYNATSAYLGIRYPYLVIEREVSNFSEYYTNENGLPCNITKTINELSGYIEMDNIHMETLTCTDEEKTMVENLLKNGIIV